MKQLTFTISLMIILICKATILNAQQNENILVYGKIQESQKDSPVAYATIRLYNQQDKLISGTISNDEGYFEIQSLENEFYLKIDFIGFKSMILKNYAIQNNQINFGIITLRIDSKNLQEVVVRSEKSQIEFKTDKRVFNVGQDLTSAGGSALDVLNNVPSVDVNIEGTVSLRGNSNVLILINGKPSVITEGNSLGTITAEMLEKVEVITNPSAKYDAEGTSGIINLILKKEDKKGTNGALSINTGYPHNHSFGMSLNRRTENFNLFSQFGLGYRRFNSTTNSYTINKTNENPSTFYTDGTGEKNEQFYNIILGTDYHINSLNVLTLTGHLGYEVEDENALLNYQNINHDNSILTNIERKDLTKGVNPEMEYQLNYDKSFKGNKDRKFTASATGSFFGKDKTSSFCNTNIIGESLNEKQIAKTNFSERSYNFMTDYVHPFSKNSTLEAGAKYIIIQLINDYSLVDSQNDEWVNNEAFTNKFDYKQNTAALYSTYNHELDEFGFKIGLRLENTQVSTLLHNNNTKNKTNYTDLFPSMHTTYKLANGLSFQAGYSRRISRPSIRDVNPFFSLRDEYNLQIGNPNLLPEYTHAFEITTVKILKFGSLSSSLFHRRTSDVMSDVVKLVDNITIVTIANIGNSYSTGLELNFKLVPAKWISFLGDANFNYYNRKGSYEETNFDFNSTAYSGRLTTKLKLPYDFDVEVRLRHNSDYKDVQSLHLARSTMDFGVRKKILKGRGVIRLTVNNVMNTDKRTEITDLPDFYRFSEYTRDGRRIILGFSFGFGKGEAMEFSGQDLY